MTVYPKELLIYRTISVLFTILIFCVFTPVPIYGQSNTVLRGLVTSTADGNTLQGANVVLTHLDSTVRKATATDVDGYYEIRGFPPARYALTVSFVGFRTYRDTLSFSDAPHTHNVTLSPRNRELDEVRVEVERGAAHREAGFQTAESQDIDRVPTPGPGGDLASYLQTQPGVVTGGSRGGNLNIRGGTASQNLFFVDGLPITKPFHISNLYSAFSQDMVKSADLYAGGFGAEYLGGTSSVIDVTLREGNMEDYAARVSVSPFISSARIEGPVESGSQSFLFALRRSTVEETAGILYGREVPLTFYDFTGRYSIQTSGATCSITGIHTYDQGRLSNERPTSLTWSNTVLGGRCNLFGEGLGQALKVSAGYSSFRNESGTIGKPERSSGLKKGIFQIKRGQNFSWGTFRWGIMPEIVSYDYTVDQRFSRFQSRTEVDFRIKAFSTLPIEVGDHLSVTPSAGLQMGGKSNSFEPRFRLAYRPGGNDRREFSFAAGKYSQFSEGITDTQDSGTEFTVWTSQKVGNGAQNALHGIIGYRQQFFENMEVSVEGYGKNISNIPVPEWTILNRFETELASANGTAYGVDARIEWTSEFMYLFLGYGWANVTYEAAQQDLGAWLERDVVTYSPSHDRRHQVNTVIGVDIGETTANVNWEFGSGRPYTKVYAFDLIPDIVNRVSRPSEFSGREAVLYDEPYGGRLPNYHRLDISLERTFQLSPAVGIETKLGAINLYNRGNIFYYDISRDNIVRQIPFYPYISLSFSIH